MFHLQTNNKGLQLLFSLYFLFLCEEVFFHSVQLYIENSYSLILNP